MVFYLKALKNNNPWDWASFGILSGLGFWSHFYALVIIGALVLYAIYELFPKIRHDVSFIRPAAIAFAVFCLLCLPLIIVTIQLFAKRTASAPAFGIQGPDLIIATFTQISGSEIVMFLFLLLFFAGIIQAFLLDRNKGIFLLTLTVLTFVISDFLSYRIPMEPRYLIFLSIVFFIAIALSHKIVYSFIKSPWVVYGFVILMLVVNAPTLAGYYSGYVKEDWRGFSGQLQNLTKNGDFVVVVPGYVSQPLNYYYSNATDRTIELTANTGEDLKAIDAEKNNATVFYVITGDITSANPGGDALAWLQEHTKASGETPGILLRTSA
jgi:hypothetical protein